MFKSICYLLLVNLLTGVFFASAEVLTDPTRPKTGVAQHGLVDNKSNDGFPIIKLEAVFVGEKERFAIIDGKTISEGGSLQGFELVKVTQTGIILRGQVQDSEKQRSYMINKNSDIKKDRSNDF